MNDSDNIPGYRPLTSPWGTNAAARRALITEAQAARISLYDATTGPTCEETVEEAWAEAGQGGGRAAAGRTGAQGRAQCGGSDRRGSRPP